MKNKTEFWKVLGIGDIDYEFTINLTQAEASYLKFDIDKVKTLQDCKSFLEHDEVREKMTISSKNNLVNLLLFLNKTNINKTFVEFLSLNCLTLSQDMAFVKEKVKTDFDDNFLFLIESNLISPCKFKLQINVENKHPKILESESIIDNNLKQEKKQSDIKKEEVKKETKKDDPKELRDDIKNEKKNKDLKNDVIDENFKPDLKKFDSKLEEPKKVDAKKEEAKKDEAKNDLKKKDSIKEEQKKNEPKKEENKTVENNTLDAKKPEAKKEEIKKEEPKKEEPKKEEPKKEEPKKEEPKKEEPKKEETKKEESKKEETKKEESKKEELKKEETKKEDSKKEETTKEEPKKDESKMLDSKSEEIKNEEVKKEEKPKGKNIQYIKSINLPSVSRPTDINYKEFQMPEGKGEQYFNNSGGDNITKYNQAIQNNVNVNNNNTNNLSKSNILYNLKYDYESVDYIFIDLNKFLSYKEISLNDLYDYLSNKIANVHNNTSIILIFPNIDKIDPSYIQILIDISSVCDIVIYDKRDSMTLCSHLGYKVEDKNFEVRFMFLKEFKKSKNKRQKTCLFLEDFHKLTIVMQETDTNLIVYHNEFHFEIGFKLDYFHTVTSNNDFLKFVFYGGFFSRVVQNQPFDVAFNVGLETFKKMLDILHNNLPLPDTPDYFLVQPKLNNKTKKVGGKTGGMSNANKKKKTNLQERENKFILDAVSMSNKKNKDNLYAQDSIGNSKKITQLPYGNIPAEDKPKTQNQFFPNTIKSPNTTNSNNYKVLEIEQKKLLSILEANEKIQQKLNKLLSMSPRGKEFLNSDNEENEGSKPLYKKNHLPKIQGNSEIRLAQTSNEFNKEPKKKNLKPISKETYDRLTGYNKTNYASEFKSPVHKQSVPNQYNDFVNSSNVIDNSPKEINLNNFQSSPVIPEEKQVLKDQNPLNSSLPNVSSKPVQPLLAETVAKKHPPPKKLVRISKELDPICNLGYIPAPEQQLKLEEKKKNEFRDYTYFDNKFRKNKGYDKLLGEKEKKIPEVVEINKSDNERGRKEDYNDLSRSIEKNRKRDEEIERKRKDEQRKLEEKLAEEKRALEKKQQEEELKLKLEKEEKAEEKKAEEKKEEKKDGKKEEGKKEDTKKPEAKKDEGKKEEKK